MIPLLAEVVLLTLIAFALGLGLAFLLEWRRRVRANWEW